MMQTEPKTNPTGWQPIKTAPKGNRLLDLWIPEYSVRLPDCAWDTELKAWLVDMGAYWAKAHGEPSHWMYPPCAPKSIASVYAEDKTSLERTKETAE